MQMTSRFVLEGACLVLAVTAGNARLHAQEVLQTWDSLGFKHVDSIGDVDGDGFRDLVVGNESINVPSNYFGIVKVVSGRTGQTIFSYVPPTQIGIGQGVWNLGDVTGDGSPNFLAGSSAGGSFVFDGRDGTIVAQAIGAQSVAVLGDMNGDGITDFLVGTGGAARVTVYLGGSFQEYGAVFGPPGFLGFGATCAGMGDVDGDGIPDYAVGAPSDPLFNVLGKVGVYSGAQGTPLYELTGQQTGDLFGGALVSPGDFTGDGIRDLVVSAQRCCGLYFGGPGRLFFYDGRNGEELGQMFAPGAPNYGGEFGRFLDETGDVNGNGFGDFILRMVRNKAGKRFRNVWLIDGGTKQVLYGLPGTIPPPPFGGGHDWNGDDFPDFLMRPQFLTLHSGAPRGVSVLGSACPSASGSAPRIGMTGAPRIGTDVEIHLLNVLPDQEAVLVLSGIGARLSKVRAVDAPCGLLIPWQDEMRTVTTALRPDEGVATATVTIPADATLIGAVFHAQWILPGTGGIVGSPAASRILRMQLLAHPSFPQGAPEPEAALYHPREPR